MHQAAASVTSHIDDNSRIEDLSAMVSRANDILVKELKVNQHVLPNPFNFTPEQMMKTAVGKEQQKFQRLMGTKERQLPWEQVCLDIFQFHSQMILISNYGLVTRARVNGAPRSKLDIFLARFGAVFHADNYLAQLNPRHS